MSNLKWIILFIISLSFLPSFSNLAYGQACPAPGEIISATLDPNLSFPEPFRTFRDGITSQCNAPKSYPGTFGGQNIYNTHTFGAVLTDFCVTVNFDVGTCDTNVFALAYLNQDDPGNQSLNYLGDIGSSITQSFSFEVPAGNNFVIVAESVNGPITCDYSFSFDAFPCQARTIPTLNETGLIILGALMLLATVFVLRKRARASA
jgi:hypothetical protein